MNDKNNSPRRWRWYLLSIGGGLILGVFCAFLTGSVLNRITNRSTYDVASQNGFSGDPDGEKLPSLLEQYDTAKLYSQVAGSVITLIEYEKTFGGETGYGFGSGVFFREDAERYFVLTNAHVVEGAEYLSAYFGAALQPEVTVIGSDISADCAVVSIAKKDLTEEACEGIRLAVLGDSGSLSAGDFVFTLGTPSDLAYADTLTAGVVSGLDRELVVNGHRRTYLQIDATLNPGNSGGGLFDERGELVGINSAKVISDDIEGISFALPIKEFMYVANRLMYQYGIDP